MMEQRTFHPFTDLPAEIRANIWRHTVEPRTVPVTCWVGNQRVEAMNRSRATQGEAWEKDLAEARRRAQTALPLELYAKTPLKPAVLDVCREARQLGLYEQMILTSGSSASYAWVNYHVDTIYLEDEEEAYGWYRNCGGLVQRLRLDLDPSDEYWFYKHSSTLKSTFSLLRECFVVMSNDARIWDWRSYDYRKWFSCPPDKIHLIDEENDERMTYKELIDMSDEDVNKWAMSSNRFGTNAPMSDDQDGDWRGGQSILNGDK